LVDGAKDTAHISKLRFYSDASQGITDEIKDQSVSVENQKQPISTIFQVRKRKSIWEFQVAWEDFDEATSENAKTLYSDVTYLVQDFVLPGGNVCRKKALAKVS